MLSITLVLVSHTLLKTALSTYLYNVAMAWLFAQSVSWLHVFNTLCDGSTCTCNQAITVLCFWLWFYYGLRVA